MEALRNGCLFGDQGEIIKVWRANGAKVFKDHGIVEELPQKKNAKDKDADKKAGANDNKKATAKKEEEDDMGFMKLEDYNENYKVEKLKARDLEPKQINTPEELKSHLEFTNGKIMTRFPPEPNGFLHIGHCKSIRFNFSVARVNNGECYLRFDDTNPAAESKEYIDSIKDSLEWLGYKPWKVTHSSDNFDRLHQCALYLIKKSKAYVCFQSKPVQKEFRESKRASPYRDSSIEENLKQFELMRMGYYNEGEACLRAKIDITSDNPVLRDPVIYRILFHPHPQVGGKWCIYPMYDFTHGCCDSFENITHSCCTLEFETRRDLYYWLLIELDMYKPYVYEFSRLNMTYTFLSKRKVQKLVDMKLICGWDDPRVYTIMGIRRRGISKDSINEFCDMVSVTRKGNDKYVQVELFEHVVRNELNELAPRTLAILDPVIIEIEDMKPGEKVEVIGLLFPNKKESSASYSMTLEREVFVDRSDVREVDSKDFYGIAPGKIIRLKYGPGVRISDKFVKDDSGRVTKIFATRLPADEDKKTKIKGNFFYNKIFLTKD